MEFLLTMSGVIGAACCVGMYAAVTFGKVQGDEPVFSIVNGVGSILILIGAAHQFDVGDAGTIGQELIWAAVSFFGLWRALRKSETPRPLTARIASLAASAWRCLIWPVSVLVADFDRSSSRPSQSGLVVAAIVLWAKLLTAVLLVSSAADGAVALRTMQAAIVLMYLGGMWVSLGGGWTVGRYASSARTNAIRLS